jgi:rod shape-determining protein MreC
MTEFLRRYSLSLTTVLLLMLSMFMTGLSVRDRRLASSGAAVVGELLAPFERLYLGTVQGARGIWNNYLYLVGVEEERRQLAERVKVLESQNSQFIELKSENERLRRLLGYLQETGAQGVAARVTSRDASNWAQAITVDRGEQHGVRVGNSVVDGNAIVGQVIAVSSSSAKIQLLTDNTSAIDSLVQNSRAQGTAEGMLGRNLRLKYVQRESPVVIGDRVIASGLDGIYPKGALVGVVTRVERNSVGMFQVIELEPSADVLRLENVLILTGGPR